MHDFCSLSQNRSAEDRWLQLVKLRGRKQKKTQKNEPPAAAVRRARGYDGRRGRGATRLFTHLRRVGTVHFFFNLTYTVTKPAQFAFLFILLTPMMLYVLTGRIQVHSFYFYSGGVFLLRRLILGAKHSAQLNAGREVSP